MAAPRSAGDHSWFQYYLCHWEVGGNLGARAGGLLDGINGGTKRGQQLVAAPRPSGVPS